MTILRKHIPLALLAAVLAAVPAALGVRPLGAQQQREAPRQGTMEERWGAANISELYYVNVPVEKVYPYRRGYMVLYRKGVNALGRAYIPFEWFRANVKKAELIQIGDGKTWPSMSVFYKEGAFHGVRLYVSRRPSHQTWGMIASTTNIDDRFDVEAIDLGFEPAEPRQ
ncbi:MAG: hypothetical protein LBD09_06680 [Treponema sp.]|nr:hypothetical protein [Treponema sp.]